jgi:hypothetical protein
VSDLERLVEHGATVVDVAAHPHEVSEEAQRLRFGTAVTDAARVLERFIEVSFGLDRAPAADECFS